jgi:pimeloyl-ACP methyl ester carboxylesterase
MRSLLTSGQAVHSTYLAAFQLPLLPEFAFARLGQNRLRTLLRRTGLDMDHASRYAARAAHPATIRGPLAWYRAIPVNLLTRTGPIDVPTLFVWSDRDRFVTRAAAEQCGRHIRGPYEFAVLAGISHWLPEEAPERVAALLSRHLAQSS